MWFGAIECTIRWDMNTPCDWRGLSNVQCNAVGAHCVVWWRLVGAVPVCPPVSPCKGASIVQSPCIMRVFFCMETPLRGRSGGHTGAAPTVSFGQIGRGWFCLLVGENGAHEPTPSVLYFCQPRVADDRRLPWVKSWRGTYAIGIVLF